MVLHFALRLAHKGKRRRVMGEGELMRLDEEELVRMDGEELMRM